MKRGDLPDSGFANPAAAHLIVRRMRMRAALTEAQGSISALLKLLDQEAEACRDARASAAEGGVGLSQGNVEGGVSGIAVDGIEGKDVREKELLEGVNLSLDQKRQFVPKLATMLTPDMKRALRDRLNEELGDA